VRSEDLNNGALRKGVPVEPLVLRANAGDCIEVNLTNGIFIDAAITRKHSCGAQFDFNMPPPLNGPAYPQKVSRSSDCIRICFPYDPAYEQRL